MMRMVMSVFKPFLNRSDYAMNTYMLYKSFMIYSPPKIILNKRLCMKIAYRRNKYNSTHQLSTRLFCEDFQ